MFLTEIAIMSVILNQFVFIENEWTVEFDTKIVGLGVVIYYSHITF